MLATVAQVLAALEQRNPVRLAADWDSVGLICGDPDALVERVLLAVDPVQSVVDEAISGKYSMIITHHPLFLRGVHGVGAVNAKGRLIHALIGGGIALAAAHTNADHANPGVSDVLGTLLGLTQMEPIEGSQDEPLATGTGTGRIGILTQPTTLAEFGALVAELLPATEHGVRIAGSPQTVIRSVAVCGGAGDSLLDSVGTRADVFVTADLRHHRAQDHLADGGCALVDVAHWASEWPWLQHAAQQLVTDLAKEGKTIIADCSTTATDPWTAHHVSPALRSGR
ncbi:MAG: Nif3-like dinuclear metal center hexameric protein [Actinomycetota bacterium]|nr:Nif3-like dinuclear metal center hexameric protein [Actinomycetota bacterium]